MLRPLLNHLGDESSRVSRYLDSDVNCSPVGAEVCDGEPMAPAAPTFLAGPRNRTAVELNTQCLGDCYNIGEVIGSGSFSIVQRAVCKATGTVWAVKKFDAGTSRDSILKEIIILSQLDHEHVIRPREYFEDSTGIALITELLTGRDLLTSLTDRGSYAEDDCRQIAKRLLAALRHCHSRGVVHRDLKLENVVLACEHDPCSVKLVDFGLAGQIQRSMTALKESCGTPAYAAPEVLQRNASYGTSPDVWSVGVLVFMLLCGAPPFVAHSLKALARNIRSGNFHTGDPAWELVSDEARDFVRALLVVKPEHRPTAAQALEHPWLQN